MVSYGFRKQKMCVPIVDIKTANALSVQFLAYNIDKIDKKGIDLQNLRHFERRLKMKFSPIFAVLKRLFFPNLADINVIVLVLTVK